MNDARGAALPPAEEITRCCARFYESDAAKALLGESLHPGGLELTERLGCLLHLGLGSCVLDVACGAGVSALSLAERFGCEVLGVDYSLQNVIAASAAAEEAGLGARARFEQADAAHLPVRDASFDAVVCECAFCTFTDKPRASRELARVLRPGGRVGLSDVTREAPLPAELNDLLAWLACIADAQPLAGYADCLARAGLAIELQEWHDDALLRTVSQVKGRLLAAELMSGLKKLELPELDFDAAARMTEATTAAIRQGKLRYALLVAEKPSR